MHPAVKEGPERLTDGSTYYWSRIFPTTWTAIVGVLIVLMWMGVLGPAPEAVKWVALGVWGGVSALFYRMFSPLKDVWLDGDEVLVGDPLRGTRINLRDITEVKESRLHQVKTVTLELSRATPLGRSISFVPKGIKTFMVPYASSPVAADLKERKQKLLSPGE